MSDEISPLTLTIKQEYLDVYIHDILTGKDIYIRLLDPILYEHFYNNGYSTLFEWI